MSQATMNGAFAPGGTHVLYRGEHDFRTRVAKFLEDPVLPAVALLLISALTIATIVLMVTTVATALLNAQSRVSDVIDPWLGLSSAPPVPYEDDAVNPYDTSSPAAMEKRSRWPDSESGGRPVFAQVPRSGGS
jgi:hypothetical protein